MDSAKLKVAMIGIGNAGCQATDLAKKEGHAVFVINSSEKDLNDSLVDKEIPSFIIGNKRGAGKNRKTAKIFMKDELTRLFEDQEFLEFVNMQDVVIVAGSTAGGTGSGAGPLLTNRLQTIYPNKIIIFFCILPKHSESAQAQFNAAECMNEVISPSLNMTYAIADLHTMEDIPNDIAYKKTAQYIVDCLNTIRGDTLAKSPYGMIDESDLLTILSAPGYMSFYHRPSVSDKDWAGKTTQAILIDTIKSSISAPLPNDKVIRNMGVILNTTEQENDPCRSGNYSELEVFIGKPLASFTNYSVSRTPTSDVGLILSGMNPPILRINECCNLAKECQALFQDRDTGAVNTSDLDSIKDYRQKLDTDRIIGISSAKKLTNVTDDIPDIFD